MNINTILSQLDKIKILSDSKTQLEYFNDHFGLPNLVFNTSDEFKTYINSIQDKPETKSSDVEDF